MKKVFILLIAAVLFSGALFAEGKSVYTVQTVTGKVTYQTSAGDWIELKSGSKLSADSIINTGLNSTLVISDGESEIAIKPMKKGTVENLIAAINSKSIVTIGSKVTASGIAAAASGSGKTVMTASSRASEAKADVEWEE